MPAILHSDLQKRQGGGTETQGAYEKRSAGKP